jgi:aspartate/methionine/tyrosine aminotransferase
MKLPAFKLERFFAHHEFKAPYLLCSSDCEAMSIQELLSLEPDAAEEFQQTWLGYTETQGAPALRQTIATLYQQISPEQVLVHSGAEEAIFIFMNTMLQAGDHIIVHFPCYQSHAEIARSLGCEVSWWQAGGDNWELDVGWLRQAIRPNTKAIVINCPHNPTGYLISHSKQRELVEIARQHNLLLFSDEVYRLLEQDDADTLPAACDLYENAVSLSGTSKTYGLAGLRIGWIATQNQQIQQAMSSFKDFTSICNSAPSEFLSTLALRQQEKIIQRNRAIVAANLKICDAFFGEYADLFNWMPPRAGSTAFPSLKRDLDVESFCTDLVNRAGVLLLPSTYFDYGNRHFRLGLGRRNFSEGIKRLGEYLSANYR